MKIVHVYAQNLKIFEDALEGTGCCVNGSKSLQYMKKSFVNFNVRDVMGLIVYRNPMTTKTAKLIADFDDLFSLYPRPIVVVCDDAESLCRSGMIPVKHCPLFALNSVDGTISDVDISKMFTTLSCVVGDMYDLSEIELKLSKQAEAMTNRQSDTRSLADEVLDTFREMEGLIGANQCTEQ